MRVRIELPVSALFFELGKALLFKKSPVSAIYV